jgi:hypothetical protein
MVCPCCPCPNELNFFRGFSDTNTWFRSAYYHDEDECYFSRYVPDGRIKVTAVDKEDDSPPPNLRGQCGLFVVSDGTNWFTEQVPVGTYVLRGQGEIALGAIWSPPAVGGDWQLVSNTKLALNNPNDTRCKNFGDKIFLELSDPVNPLP